jgi:hypothetical protein
MQQNLIQLVVVVVLEFSAIGYKNCKKLWLPTTFLKSAENGKQIVLLHGYQLLSSNQQKMENRLCCFMAANYSPQISRKWKTNCAASWLPATVPQISRKWHGTYVKIQIRPLEFTIQFRHVTSV